MNQFYIFARFFLCVYKKNTTIGYGFIAGGMRVGRDFQAKIPPLLSVDGEIEMAANNRLLFLFENIHLCTFTHRSTYATRKQ